MERFMQVGNGGGKQAQDGNPRASDWRTRIILGERVGLADFPEWLGRSYEELHSLVMHPEYPCFFGTMAERRGEMFYSYVRGKDTSGLPATMATFTRLANQPEYRRNNIAIFFEPDAQPLSHQAYHDLFWNTLQYLHNVDPDPLADQQPDPSDETWEFSFGGIQMFVVCACPSFRLRHSRNLGPGMVLLFQPRAVFVDTITNKVIGREARNQVRERLRKWDDVPPHPDLGFYGDPGNLEWKQYFLAGENVRATDQCPFLKRVARERRQLSGDATKTAENQEEALGAADRQAEKPDAGGSSASLTAIARTYAALSPDRRAAFRSRLQEMNIPASKLPMLSLTGRSNRFPLSPAQERLWFLWRLDPSSASYNIAGALRLQGKLSVRHLHAAFDLVVARHEILRVRFEEWDGQLAQMVNGPDVASYRWEEMGFDDNAEFDARLRSLSLDPFDLERGPLLRVTLLAEGGAEESHVLHIAMHHIISDHASLNLMIEEIVGTYRLLSDGTSPSLPALPIQYGDYVAWQREWSDDSGEDPHLAYWVQRLGAEHPVLELPVSRSCTGARSGNGARVGMTLAGQQFQRLKRLSSQHRTTLFTTLLAAYALLLARYSGQTDVRIGVPVSGRSRNGTEGLIGFFVNTLVIRAELPEGSATFGSLLTELHRRVVEAHEHQDVSFSQLVKVLQPERTMGHTPLFQVMFNHTHTVQKSMELAGLRISELPNDVASARFDLVLNVVERDEELRVSFNYSTDCFDETNVRRILNQYAGILERISTDPNCRLGQITVCEGEPARAERGGQFEAVGEQFSQQAMTRENAPALNCEGERLSYRELEHWSNRIANRLIRAGVRPDECIGLCVDRSPALVASVLGVLKSGAAFVPLDPAYPLARLATMLDDAGITRMLVDSVGATCIGSLAGSRDQIDVISLQEEDDRVSRVLIHPEQLAYVIYTSGSTGRPKGVAITHGSLSRHLRDFIDTYRISEADIQLQSSTLNFDVALHELLPALLCGGQVEMRGSSLWDPDTTSRHLIDAQVTFARIPTAYWQQWLLEPPAAASLALRQITVGGEGLPGDALEKWHHGPLRHIRLDNLYGPTETTIACMYRNTDEDDSQQPIVSIGLTYPSRSAHVLDADGNEVPIGGIGELCIGGHTLARGYLQRPGLTAERFVPAPFGTQGERLYRTGDLCRRRLDGSIDFLGRLDQQVKLRGFRIEPGEIEAALRDISGVQAAVVMLHGEGETKRLIGYLSGDLNDLDEAVMRRELEKRLPGYMVPSVFVRIASLPIMPNGKVDRASLPTPDFNAIRKVVAPRTALEAGILDIWHAVLGRDGLCVTNNFFDVGGHSLLLMRVASRIRQEMGLDVSLQTLFEHPVLASLAAELGGRESGAVHTIGPREPGGRVPLTWEQERLWFLWKLEPKSAAYTIAGALHVNGVLDTGAVRRALDQLVGRHEILRTRFVEDDGAAVQIVGTALHYGWVEEQIESRAQLELRLRTLSRTPFDLQCGPVLRVALLTCGNAESALHFAMPHIVTDAWSQAIFLREFSQLYRAACQNEQAHLASLPIQYGDYASWQRAGGGAQESEAHYEYWLRELAGEQLRLTLPVDRARVGPRSSAGGWVRCTLDKTLSRALEHRSREHGATRFMTLLAAYGALLRGYCAQDDIRIGVPVAGRDRVETEPLIGFFVNTVVIHITMHDGQPFSALLAEVREKVLGAYEHANAPFARLVERLHPSRSLDETPLFQALFNYNAERRAPVELPGLEVHTVGGTTGTSQFDLTLDVSGDEDQLRVGLNYATDILNHETAERLLNSYVRALRQIVEHMDMRVVTLLDDGERDELLSRGGNVQDVGEVEPVHVLIERQARLQPEALAVVCGEQALSYGELNARANRLAWWLRRAGVGPEVCVGIAVERSMEMVVGLLGILKAGGAYVPLDPSYPGERLSYMIADSGIGVLLTQSHLRGVLPLAGGVELIELDTLDVSGEPETNLDVSVLGENLAYVIYTSGSTGRPKGAANRHGALYNRLAWMQQAYGLSASDTVLQKTPFSFDVSVWEFFWPLMVGARLAMAGPGEHRDPHRLIELIDGYRVTTLHFVPSMLQAFIECGQAGRCVGLKRIICSGEALPAELQDRVLGELPGVGLYNLYGPTEAAIDVTHWTCLPGTASVPIGRPISNVRTYVLDAGGELSLPGVAGELYLGGAGLARGYLRRPSLTAERFVPDPFGEAGGRLYRTGDLARWNREGELEYLGRIDHQVKVRGFRIELGEIEARLLSQAGVREAAVVAQEGPGGVRLAGYVTARGDCALNGVRLREALSGALPDYMVPGVIVVLEALPLNANGKVDRRALPQAEYVSRGYEAPQGEVEEVLSRVWGEVLGVERVGRYDNFFELGGDSILSLKVVAKAHQAGVSVTPRQVFARQTISQLAQVADFVTEKTREADDEETQEAFPLLPIQAQFFEQEIPHRHLWNQALLLKSQEPFDNIALARAVQVLVRRHAALRMRFTRDAAGHWTQSYAPPYDDADILWVRRAHRHEEIEVLCIEAQGSLDIERGPMLRVLAIEAEDGTYRLLLAIHHLVVDGVSWRVLMDDLQTMYVQICTGESINLPSRTSSYRVWVARVTEYARGAETNAQQSHWQAIAEVPCRLPCDDPSAPDVLESVHRMTRRLSNRSTRALLQEAPSAYRTQINELLLTALGRALCTWTGQPRIRIDVEGHGREDLFDGIDLSRTVGWFTSLFPVALEPCGAPGDALKRVKESLRKVPNHGLTFGLLRHLGDPAVRDALAAIEPSQVVFNYLGQFDSPDARSKWTPAVEKIGASRDPGASSTHELTVSGRIYAGQLTLTISYGSQRYRKRTIEALIDAYHAELESLIAHCTSGAVGVTPSDFPLCTLDQTTLDLIPLPWAEIQDIYPATPLQAGLLFHSLQEKGRGVYINQKRYTLGGLLDYKALHRAWDVLLARHDILRTGFSWAHGGDVLQVVRKKVSTPFHEHNWSAMTQADYDSRLRAWLGNDLAHGFSLEQGPLLRINLFARPDRQHDLVWTDHHVLMDGWSTTQLLGEMLHIYGVHATGSAVDLPAPRSYREYVEWLGRHGDMRPWWEKEVARIDDPATLTASLPMPATIAVAHNPAIQQLDDVFDSDLSLLLQKAAQQYRITLNTLVQAAWAILLARYGNREQVAFGVTVSGRENELRGVDRMLGLFINSLPLWVDVPAGAELGGWLEKLQQYNSELRANETVSLSTVQTLSGRSGDALFDSLIVFENYPVDRALRQLDTGFTLTAKAVIERTHYPMVLAVVPGDQVRMRWKYRSERFDEATVRRLHRAYRSILEQIVSGANVHVGDIVAEGDLPEPIAIGRHDALVSQHGFRPVTARVSAQAAKYPAREAVHCEGNRCTYSELEALANRVGRRLKRFGARADERIGLCVERSAELIASLLGILKSGAAFVPLDPSYPSERLSSMLDDADVTYVVTDKRSMARMADVLGSRKVVVISELEDEATDPYAESVHPDQLAYVIYTSGSTGQPKGVAVSHGSLSRHLDDFVATYRLTESDRQLQSSTINFDVSLHEMLPALSVGGQVEMRGPHQWDLETASRHLIEKRVTFARIPTAYWQQWLRVPPAAQALHALRQITVGGEALPGDALRQWRAGPLAHIRVDNLYGPTETTIACMYRQTIEADACGSIVSIGKPYPSRRAYVLDPTSHEVPVDGLGELHIGGLTLARGYLGRPALTAEKFIPDPFANDGARLYRTGDLCRRRPDRRIDFLGRLDQQVKLRGLRIETGEVEAALRQVPGVSDALVALGGDGENQQLVGYVVGDANESGIRRILEARLPAYMMPSTFVYLDKLPMMLNGKVDRAALPVHMPASVGYVAPGTPSESRLLAIWNDVLRRRDLGVMDDFFAAGGNSLLALKVLARATQEGMPGVTLEALFQLRTVRALGAHLDRSLYGGDDDRTAAGNVVRMNGHAEGPNLFAIHPASGLVADYRPLAAALDGVATVYGVQAPFYTEEWWVDDLPALAADYAARIRTVQPDGPFRLIGWSIGGLIATEVARMLAQDGYEVALVGLIDTHVLDVDDGRDDRPVTRDQIDTYRVADEELQQVMDGAAQKWPEFLDGLSDGDMHALLGKVVLFQRHLGHIVRYRKHAPLPLDLKLWWAVRAPYRPMPESTSIWSARTRGHVSVLGEIDADHRQIVRHPDLFEDLSRVLAVRDVIPVEDPS